MAKLSPHLRSAGFALLLAAGLIPAAPATRARADARSRGAARRPRQLCGPPPQLRTAANRPAPTPAPPLTSA
jgi:hypothetical protein